MVAGGWVGGSGGGGGGGRGGQPSVCIYTKRKTINRLYMYIHAHTHLYVYIYTYIHIYVQICLLPPCAYMWVAKREHQVTSINSTFDQA